MTATTAVAIVISVLPVLLFLGALVLIDSYKLVVLRAILLSIGAGVVAALAAYAANVTLRPALGLGVPPYSMYVAPVVEELLKAAFVVVLLRRSRVGFVVDAAIHGFAIGTGFALVENLYYVEVSTVANLWTWVVRGFGTAIMHGGATAIVAMVAQAFHDRAGRDGPFRLRYLVPGLAMASHGNSSTISAVARNGCTRKWLYSECSSTAMARPGTRCRSRNAPAPPALPRNACATIATMAVAPPCMIAVPKPRTTQVHRFATVLTST